MSTPTQHGSQSHVYNTLCVIGLEAFSIGTCWRLNRNAWAGGWRPNWNAARGSWRPNWNGERAGRLATKPELMAQLPPLRGSAGRFALRRCLARAWGDFSQALV